MIEIAKKKNCSNERNNRHAKEFLKTKIRNIQCVLFLLHLHSFISRIMGVSFFKGMNIVGIEMFH